MRACRACRPRCGASTATASCVGARLPLEPRHAAIRNHRVLIVSLCLVRRGLALIIESDFYATDAGRQHFADRKCHASNPTTSPLDSRGDFCVRRAHVDPLLVGPRLTPRPCLAIHTLTLTPAPPVCLAASKRPATLTCSTRAFPQLEPLQHGIGEAGLCLTVLCCVCRYLTSANYDFSYDRSKNLR